MNAYWWSDRKGKGSGVLNQKLWALSALVGQPRRTAAELLLPGKPNKFLAVIKKKISCPFICNQTINMALVLQTLDAPIKGEFLD